MANEVKAFEEPKNEALDSFEEMAKAFIDQADGNFSNAGPVPYLDGEDEEAEQPAEEPAEEESDDSEESEDSGNEEDESEEDSEEEADDDEILSLKQEIQKLRAEINKKPQEESESKYELLDFVRNEDEFDQITSSKENLNAWANRIHLTALTYAKRDAEEIAQRVYREQLAQAELRQRFYAENPDLQKHARVVQTAASEIDAKFPTLFQDDFQKYLQLVAKESRKELGLKAPKPTVTKDKQRGAFAKQKGGARRPAPVDSRSSMQQEIDQMLAKARR